MKAHWRQDYFTKKGYWNVVTVNIPIKNVYNHEKYEYGWTGKPLICVSDLFFKWIKENLQGCVDINEETIDDHTRHTYQRYVCVYCSNTADAMLCKLVWGGL